MCCNNILTLFSTSQGDLISFVLKVQTDIIDETYRFGISDTIVREQPRMRLANGTLVPARIEYSKTITFNTTRHPPTDEIVKLCDEFPTVEILLIYHNIEDFFYGLQKYQSNHLNVVEDYDIKSNDFIFTTSDNVQCEPDDKNASFCTASGNFQKFLSSCGLRFYYAIDSETDNKENEEVY